MSKDYHQAALKDVRKVALESVHKISADLARYTNSGHKDSPKHQLMFAANVLTGICRNCEELREKAHYDIYVDIFLRVLSPNLNPAASPTHWKRILSYLEYFYLMISTYELVKEANALHKYIHAQKGNWPDFEDAKSLLKIHGSHMQLQCTQLNNTAHDIESIHSQALCAVDGLETLFLHLAKQEKKPATFLMDFVIQFPRFFISRRNTSQIHLGTTLRTKELECMYSAYFNLLNASVEIVPVDVNESTLSAAYEKHLETVRNFFQLDVHSKLQQQTVLHYTRICRKIVWFQQNDYMTYCSALLYNFIKLAYVQTRIRNFGEGYKELCVKFTTLLRQSGEVLIVQSWFQDFLVLIYLMLDSMQPICSDTFQCYWSQIDTVGEAHFQLIASCFVMLNDAAINKLVEYKCCDKRQNWRHLQMGLAQIAVETYIYCMKQYDLDANKFQSITTSYLKHKMGIIFKISIDTLLAMDSNCSKFATELKRFFYNFANMIHSSNNAAHASFCISLGEELTRLKSRISAEDWLIVMRRLYKAGTVCENVDKAAELHCCYIAEIICSAKQPPLMQLQSQLQLYYTNSPESTIKNGACLTDVYANLKSPFKPLLQKHEKRLLHWLEMQYVHKYYNHEDNRPLFLTLAQRSQSKYDFINAVHAGKLLDSQSIYTNIENIYDVLRNAKLAVKKNSPLTRLEELTFAHVACLLHFHRCEKLKTNLSSKDFNEGNLEVLMQDKSLLSLNVNDEMEMIEKASEALRAFQTFFEKFDIESLPSTESGYLDWTRILEDLVSLGFYFQVTGYMDFAIGAWLLHYRISNMIDDLHSSLRSLAFFCEHPHLIEYNMGLDIEAEISLKTSSIVGALKYLPQQLKRQQNFVLTCICQIAHYHASRHQFQRAETLIKLVYACHRSDSERRHKYDIVLFTADMVQFRILWKYKPNSTTSSPCDYSLIPEIDAITERMRSFVLISSADSMPYSLLVINAISEFAECAANRMTDSFLVGYFGAALKIVVDTGAAVRTAQLLSKWAYINLQMEYIQKAEIKFIVIESILNLRCIRELSSSLKAAKSCAVTASKHLHNADNNYQDVEAVRKQHISPASIKSKHSPDLAEFNRKLQFYLDLNENIKNLDSNPVNEYLQWAQMILGCLRARSRFLVDHFGELQCFYDNCFKWQEQRRHSFHYKIFRSSILLCMLHYGNFLRKTQKYEMAVKHLEVCIARCAVWSNELDPFYIVNMKEQLVDAKLEQIENVSRVLPTKNHTARCLKFDSSPELVGATPISKPSRCAPLHMTTAKHSKPKTAAFAIYSDRKSPRRTCKELKKPTASVMKVLKFSHKSDSGSGSESSIERETQNSLLNNCQVIELSDSDDELKQREEELHKVKNKLGTLKGSKLQFFESVELEELPTSSSSSSSSSAVVTTKRNQTSSKTNKNQTTSTDSTKAKENDLLVAQIEKLTIETSTAELSKSSSKSIKARGRPRKFGSSSHSSPNVKLKLGAESNQSPDVAGSTRRVTRRRQCTKTPNMETKSEQSPHLNSVDRSRDELLNAQCTEEEVSAKKLTSATTQSKKTASQRRVQRN